MNAKAQFVVVFLVVFVDLVNGQAAGYVEKQLLCALDRAPCDRMGRQIRAILPEIIGNKCQNCTAAQVTYANTIARYIQQSYPQAWGALLEKYS